MKKIVSTLIILFFLVLTSLIIILSTIGIETNRFNKVISKKINQINNNINLKLTSIKFKLDIKEIGLFVETNNSRIDYRETIIPAKNIKVYIDFFSLIKSDPKIKKINLVFSQIDIVELKKISATFKPSNFTSFINNKIKQATLPPDISTNCAAASAVPPVAIKSSMIKTLSFFSIESLCTSIVAVPYSNSKSTECTSAGSLFFFLNIMNGFFKI